MGGKWCGDKKPLVSLDALVTCLDYSTSTYLHFYFKMRSLERRVIKGQIVIRHHEFYWVLLIIFMDEDESMTASK